MDFLTPGDSRRLFETIHHKGAQWAVLDSVPRVVAGAPSNAAANAAVNSATVTCKYFQKGYCRRGKECRFLHENARGQQDHAKKGKGKGKGGKGPKSPNKKGGSDKDRCFACGEVTSPPHRAANCPKSASANAATAAAADPPPPRSTCKRTRIRAQNPMRVRFPPLHAHSALAHPTPLLCRCACRCKGPQTGVWGLAFAPPARPCTRMNVHIQVHASAPSSTIT